MGFFELLGLFTFFYYLITITLWLILDCDIELAYNEKFGQPISSLRAKVVWITGASSGIGKDLAISLAKNGVRLILSARREDKLQEVKDECLSVCRGLIANDDILVLPMDMLNIESHEKYFKDVITHFGRLDILVNNAGRSQRAEWDKIDIQVDRDLFELDVFAVVNLSRIAVRHFKETGGGKGHLAITSSGAGVTAVPFSASYCGAKHSLSGYFSSLKLEEPSIDVTIYCPGPIATNFLAESFTDKKDIKYGKHVGINDRRMSSERCGYLFAIALANKTFISWAGVFPVSILLYIASYYPNLRFLIMKILGKTGLQKIREGK